MNRHYSVSLANKRDKRKSDLLCDKATISLGKDECLLIMDEHGENVLRRYERARVIEIAAHVIILEAFEQKSAFSLEHRTIYAVYTL